MSNERRHLRFLITSALLVGPAVGCGTSAETNVAPVEVPMGAENGTESPVPEVNTQYPVTPPAVIEEPPTGNPAGPEPQRPTEPPVQEPTGTPVPSLTNDGQPTPIEEPRPRVNTQHEMRPGPLP